MPLPPEPNSDLIKISPDRQVVDAVKESTTIIHVHNGDVVFYLNNKMFRIGEIEELIMAERTYTSTTTNSPGAATAQGDGANASGSALQTNASSPIDFDELAIELAALRAEMRKRADGAATHDKAIAAIAEAEDSAKAKDEPALRGHLIKAGAWALDVAKDLSVAVAAEYIKGLLGGT